MKLLTLRKLKRNLSYDLHNLSFPKLLICGEWNEDHLRRFFQIGRRRTNLKARNGSFSHRIYQTPGHDQHGALPARAVQGFGLILYLTAEETRIVEEVEVGIDLFQLKETFISAVSMLLLRGGEECLVFLVLFFLCFAKPERDR